jgi:hypothetical protein
VLENEEIEGLLSSSAQLTTEREGLDPWTLYLYAMKSPATKEKYVMRLGKFLNFLNPQKGETLEDKIEPLQRKEEMIMFGLSITSSSLYNYSKNALTVKK